MYWLILFISGFLETVWVLALKKSDNFSNLVPSAVMVVSIVTSFVLFSVAIRHIPVGIAYAIWCGMGAAGVIIGGMIFFREPVSFWSVFFVSLIVIGIIGVRVISES